MKREVQVKFHMLPEEKLLLDAMCEKLKISRSEYLRIVAVTPSTATASVNEFKDSYAEVAAQLADRLPRSTPMDAEK